MPLVAVRQGERLEAHTFDDTAWVDLKATYRTTGLVMACGNPGYPKTSPRGMKFFSHFPNTDCQAHESGPETPEHLAAKAAIADAARAHGWTATIEYPADDRSWIADVLVENGVRRIAIEVQWSPQTPEEFARRQQRYEAAGLECVWFVNRRNIDATMIVPAYVLDGDVDGFTAGMKTVVGGGPEQIPLADAIRHVLDDDIVGRAEIRVTGLVVTTAMMKCWRDTCKAWMSFWWLSGAEFETRCGQTGALLCNEAYVGLQKSRIEPSVQEQVTAAFETSDRPPAVKFQTRNSKTAGFPYMAACCPACGALQGDMFILSEPRRYVDYRIPGRAQLPIGEAARREQHVCADHGRGLCSQTPQEQPPAAELFPRTSSPWEVTSDSLDYEIDLLPPKRRKGYTPPAPEQRKMPRFQ